MSTTPQDAPTPQNHEHLIVYFTERADCLAIRWLSALIWEQVILHPLILCRMDISIQVVVCHKESVCEIYEIKLMLSIRVNAS